ncbi:SDR family NAD(P)-dependent oxidoreductase [Nocardia puris]|uniref:SDR family NAD(P)-dependent oxidoreductase n=1 Tax=Nocardia puris TaxID=208602 RepID=UPI002E1AAEBC
MQTALITGGSAGIGQATARLLASRGIGVIITFRSHPEEAEQTVTAIESEGGAALALPLDLAAVRGIDDFVVTVTDALRARWSTGTLDYLVNNAGFGGPAMFADITEETFDALHNVLFKGSYFLTQKLLPVLADGAAIVNTGSTSALPSRTTPGYSAYAAYKSAMHTVTAFWAKELAPRGIRVNAVAPGTTRTRIADDAFTRMPELVPAIAEAVALGRIGEPDDVAKAIAFLLSDEAAWITGQVLEVSGGERL